MEEMQKRTIRESVVREILANPDAVRSAGKNRLVLHKILIAEDAQKALLYRVFVDVDSAIPVVVTVYKTSKIVKYEQPQ